MSAACIGLPKCELDTPALLVDVSALERNLATMRALALRCGIACRPHTKAHKSPLVAHKQLAAGATGICCAKLGEAEVMAASGITDILVTTELVGTRKIARLISLARQARLRVVVDDAAVVATLSEAAKAGGVEIGVLVDVNVGQHRCGVSPGPAAVALARRVARSESLAFGGLQGYHGGIQMLVDFAQRRAESRNALGLLAETAELLRREGLSCQVLTGGGTGTAAIDAEAGTLTELQPGSYLFMDARYRAIQWTAEGAPPPFENSMTVLGTVLSRPSPDRAVVDVGMKAASCDQGPVVPLGVPGARFEFAGDEHGILHFESATCPLSVGEPVEFLPSHCDTTVNLYDWIFALRTGRVEAVWPVAGRGCAQ